MTWTEFLDFTIAQYKSFELTPRAIGAMILLFFGFWLLIRIIRKLLKAAFRKKPLVEEARVDGLIIVIRYFAWFVYFLICLKLVGIQITWLMASSAALMVGVGLGLQNVFNDFVSGIILLFEGTVDPEDIITVDGMVGKVKKVGIRTSQIITRNNITIVVPNHKLTEDSVINWSHMHEDPRYSVKVGVAYGSDTEKVMELLVQSAVSHSKVSKKREPFARFIRFGDSSLDFELFFWSEEIFLIEDVQSQIRLNVDKAFRQSNISVPFPQRDLHIKSELPK